MRVTYQFVKDSFDKFNKLCFEGVLPIIPIRLTEARTFLGKVTYKSRKDFFGLNISNEDFVLSVSTSFDLPENELEDVVLHEMIHYYLAWRGIRDTSVHGDAFKKMMETINLKYGRHINIRHRIEEDQPGSVDVRYRANYICVSQLEDGNWGITVSATTRIFELNRELPRYYRLKSMTWYGSIDPYFNTYPRCKTPKIYGISKEELDAHLVDATLLKCDGHTICPA